MRKIPVKVFRNFLSDLNLKHNPTVIIRTKENISIDAYEWIRSINPF